MTRLSKLAVIAMALSGASAGAQTPNVVGVVRDSAGVPIRQAEILVLGRRTYSDSVGRFYLSIPASDTVTINVRRLGFQAVSFSLSAKDLADNSLDVVLRKAATELAVVEVTGMEDRAKTALRGYDERRAKGFGVFVTREEIEKRNTRLITDVLRQAPGVIVKKGAISFTAYQYKSCGPMLWLDGQAAPGLSLDAISATDVEGIELYQSIATTPAEFRRSSRRAECGTIVIWTKRPMLEVKRPKP